MQIRDFLEPLILTLTTEEFLVRDVTPMKYFYCIVFCVCFVFVFCCFYSFFVVGIIKDV